MCCFTLLRRTHGLGKRSTGSLCRQRQLQLLQCNTACLAVCSMLQAQPGATGCAKQCFVGFKPSDAISCVIHPSYMCFDKPLVDRCLVLLHNFLQHSLEDCTFPCRSAALLWLVDVAQTLFAIERWGCLAASGRQGPCAGVAFMNLLAG